jgi:hypothetical protein
MHGGYKAASLATGKNVQPYKQNDGWASEAVSKFRREKRNSFS